MLGLSIAYNALAAACDLAALAFLRRRRTARAWIGVTVAAGLAVLILALILGGDRGSYPFRAVRLATFGLFLHGPFVLFGGAAMLGRARPKTAILSVLLGAAIVGTGIDAFLIEPTALEVTHYRFSSPKLDRPLRLVVIADLQTDGVGDYERQAVRRALEEKPDVLIFAGDQTQVDEAESLVLTGELNALFREEGLSAPLGVFAIRGNTDGDSWSLAFEGLPVQAVRQSERFTVGPIDLTCLEKDASFRWRKLSLPPADPRRYHVVVGHSPNFALSPNVDADLLIAGHTHGGQIVLPLIGPLVTNTAVPRPWASGLTELSGGKKLLVSRGVGMERAYAPRLRFLCRPELVVIDLEPGE